MKTEQIEETKILYAQWDRDGRHMMYKTSYDNE